MTARNTQVPFRHFHHPVDNAEIVMAGAIGRTEPELQQCPFGIRRPAMVKQAS